MIGRDFGKPTFVVAFFVRHFSERGTEVALYNWAHYNELLLGHRSLIICFSPSAQKRHGLPLLHDSRSRFEQRFDVVEIDAIEEMRSVIAEHGVSHFFTHSAGHRRDLYQFENRFIWGRCQTIYHSVFPPMARQGCTVRCVLGEWLNQRTGKRLPVVPLIVEPHRPDGDLRDDLGIPSDAIVIGRHGGYGTFSIDYAKQVVIDLVHSRPDVYFLFLNTETFYEHERIVHLEATADPLRKGRFIESCDAMLHARAEGETFGLAVLEFSAANKPVITCRCGDQQHVINLGNKALYYDNEAELRSIFFSLDELLSSRRDWNAAETLCPERVMPVFEQICLRPPVRSVTSELLELWRDWRYYFLSRFARLKRRLQPFVFRA